jgi:hypothetical protein
MECALFGYRMQGTAISPHDAKRMRQINCLAEPWAMNRNRPKGLSQHIADAVMSIQGELENAGWTFGEFDWDNEGDGRKLKLSAKSPSGRLVYIACHENGLVQKLQQLLDLPR